MLNASRLDRLLASPALLCSFRPLFLAVLASALVGVALWLGFLGHGLPLPAVAGGPLVWHGHELLFGFGLAAVAGFVLTAVPEFTATAAFGRRVGLFFLLLWLAARLSFWLSGIVGPWPAARRASMASLRMRMEMRLSATTISTIITPVPACSQRIG